MKIHGHARLEILQNGLMDRRTEEVTSSQWNGHVIKRQMLGHVIKRQMLLPIDGLELFGLGQLASVVMVLMEWAAPEFPARLAKQISFLIFFYL